MRHEVIVGVERRRRWSDEEKLSVLSEIGVGGATVSDIARRHDLTRQHIYQWRRQMKDKGLWPCPGGTAFLALDDVPIGGFSARPQAAGSEVEIVLLNGRVLRGLGDLSDHDLARLIRVAEIA
jgi:transposase